MLAHCEHILNILLASALDGFLCGKYVTIT